ncbi:MAG: MoaF N-terminal domain-containing protein, partial [Eubacteriales bacterium]|nr:MoaF N-terminal domain-containing protein [Eubacteriales bacterium]
MNIELKSFPFESKDKFLTVLDHTLTGKAFHVRMEHGEQRLYLFATDGALLLGQCGKPTCWYPYKALRADEQTYMVAIEMVGQKYPTCSTMIFDLENGLVTEVRNKIGTVPGYPRMAVVEYQFGAICEDGQPKNSRRHGYTTDLIGMKVNWYYATGFVNTHYYYDPMYYRCKAYYVPGVVENMVADE